MELFCRTTPDTLRLCSVRRSLPLFFTLTELRIHAIERFAQLFELVGKTLSDETSFVVSELCSQCQQCGNARPKLFAPLDIFDRYHLPLHKEWDPT